MDNFNQLVMSFVKWTICLSTVEWSSPFAIKTVNQLFPELVCGLVATLRNVAKSLDYNSKRKNSDHQKLRKQDLVEVSVQ